MEPISIQLFEEVVAWLEANYKSYHFFEERDIVWTMQTHMLSEIGKHNLDFKIYDNHKCVKDKHADLAILNGNLTIDTLIEVKYEPDHTRANIDIYSKKFPRVYWNNKRYGGVEPDIDRIRNLVRQGIAKTGYSIFIDEGSHFATKSEPEGSVWVEWGTSPYSNKKISVLVSKFTTA